jgi:hypothetical protein
VKGFVETSLRDPTERPELKLAVQITGFCWVGSAVFFRNEWSILD